jgi:hypothetical protein
MNAQSAVPLPFLFLCLFITIVVGAANNDTTASASDGAQMKVGWKGGPTQRGTLMLVYGCLSTVFASTWTVLHLNVPVPDDSAWTRTLRKIKWMAINIIFPEFIFSKAVCELRLAVADLYAMHNKLKGGNFKWETKEKYGNVVLKRTWTWKAEFSPPMERLHKLLRLSQLPKVEMSGFEGIDRSPQQAI